MQRPTYLDFAATTPVDPQVSATVLRLMAEEFGNSGSRTHEFGAEAAKAVEEARQRVAQIVDADPSEVIFTSGATEANNLAVLGLAPSAEVLGKRHILSTAIEHKAVLEPLERLSSQGFEIELVEPDVGGAVDAADLLGRVRPDTLLVSVMQVNNETGVRQPVGAIAEGLADNGPFLQVDAAQGFGKEPEPLRCPRIDMISLSGHKIFAPKGVGALIARRRGRRRPPLAPLLLGGGQERGLRPGTVPVPLVAGLGLAAEIADRHWQNWAITCTELRGAILEPLLASGAQINGDPKLSVPHIANVSFPGLDSEAVILALREVMAISNGSACTSARYTPSHVLSAMGLDDDRRRGAIRLSWGPDVVAPSTAAVNQALSVLR
jgi:cysteine desulfurase